MNRILLFLLACAPGLVYPAQPPVAQKSPVDSIEALGWLLFFDPSLSKNRSQFCATCHAPNQGFVDKRGKGVLQAVSLGDDSKSLGDRNTPSAAYAKFSPRFHRNAEGEYVSGQFLDGREPDLAGQAGGPPLNPIEMGMPDEAAVVARLQENPLYVDAFKAFYGAHIWSDPKAAYRAMAESIAPFDSKYDRYLRGEYQLTTQEDLGMTLFFSQQFTNCNLCHQLERPPGAEGETFSNYEYHNIGTPAHDALRALNGKGEGFVDRGLLENPAVDDPAQAGKFKVPTLRNVAITGPYMRNGVFEDLRTVVLFYNKYNTRSAQRQINPETGEPWRDPEVAENLALEELQTGPALDDRRIEALVAFMKTLTDRRYEHLLD